MTWATEAQTADITGVIATAAQVTQAQYMIELFAGVTEQYKIKTRDVRHLRMAVAYQAAWLNGQIDVTSRTDVQQVTQDEMSFTYQDADSTVLAPMAKRALKRLSWKTNRSVRLRRPVDVLERRDFDQEFITDTGDSESEYRPWAGA